MESVLKLPDLKGAPLSILVFLSMTGNRAVSVTELAKATGFTEKPIRAGLEKLKAIGMITSPQNFRYQLPGAEYQLPLSWGEKIQPVGNSPYYSGNIPGMSGEIPELLERVEQLERAVFGDQLPAAGEIPEKTREIPEAALLDTGKDDDVEIIDEPRAEYSGNIPGKMGVFPFERKQNANAGKMVEVKGQWATGEIPGKTGDFPENTGEIPGDQLPADEDLRSRTGEIPEKSGNIPGRTGDFPEMLINNINTPKEEVSKQVSKSTYLPQKNNTEVNLTPSTVEIPDSTGEVSRWKAALQQMEGLMGKQTFTTILKDAVLLGYEDGHYTVGVKNQMVKDWADQRCRNMIEGMLSRMGYGQQSVSFVVSAAASETVKPAPKSVSFAQLDSVQELRPATLDALHGDGELVEICNDYLLDPVGIEYSREELQELINMHPDPKVLRFVLPKMSEFDSAKWWCGLSIKAAKEKLLKKYFIADPAKTEFVENDEVSLELIQRWCSEYSRKDNGLAIKKIREFAGVDEIPE